MDRKGAATFVPAPTGWTVPRLEEREREKCLEVIAEVLRRRDAIVFSLNWTVLSNGQLLKGGRKARPYKKPRTHWVGAGFIPAR